MRIQNKKGMGEGISIIFAGLLIFFIIIISFTIINWMDNKDKGDLDSEMYGVNENMVLINLLRTPVSTQYNLGELVALYVYEKDTYKKELKKELNEILTFYYGEKVCWYFYVDDEEFKNSDCENRAKQIEFTQTIPGLFSEDQKPITVRLVG